MSPRARMLAGFAAANAVIVIVAALVLLNRPPAPPLIQGILLPQARELADFSLLDHHNRAFTNDNLAGRWHLVSYGFTTCPDICPTTLSQLAQVNAALEQRGGNEDLRVLFYTVDHRRDTVQQMASYVPFFDEDFVGLTHVDQADNPHLPFEQGLGIVAQLVPVADADPSLNAYQVNHGVSLLLINPDGELQAIFEPDRSAAGVHSFDPDKVLRDYLAIRGYLG